MFLSGWLLFLNQEYTCSATFEMRSVPPFTNDQSLMNTVLLIKDQWRWITFWCWTWMIFRKSWSNAANWTKPGLAIFHVAFFMARLFWLIFYHSASWLKTYISLLYPQVTLIQRTARVTQMAALPIPCQATQNVRLTQLIHRTTLWGTLRSLIVLQRIIAVI